MHNLDEKRKITIMIAIIIALFFAMINQTIVGTATPRIIAQLGGMEYYSWIITAFLLTASIATILVGKLSDIYGRKPFLLAGLGIFIIGSLLAGTSTTIFQLITYRGIQGAGSGIIMSIAFIAVGDLYSPRERGKWQGIMSGVFGLASILGPILGGIIVDQFSWRWVFWIFLPFGIIAFLVIMRLFPSIKEHGEEKIDYLGSIFITFTIIPLLIAFSLGGQEGFPWDGIKIIGLFAAAGVSLIIFIIAESVAKNPIIPLFLFKNNVFTISNVVNFIVNAGMMGAVIYIPYFMQGVLGFSASYSSYLMIPMTISMMIGSAIAGNIMSKTGKYKWVAYTGLLFAAIGMYLLSTMKTDASIIQITINNLFLGAGLGMTMPVFSLTVQNAVEHKLLGTATAASALFRSLGGTIGIAVMSTVMTHRLSAKMAENVDASRGELPLPKEIGETLEKPEFVMDPEKLASTKEALPPEFQDIFMQIVQSIREAMGYSISGVFLFGAIVIAFAIIVTIFLKEVPLRSTVKTSSEMEKVEEK